MQICSEDEDIGMRGDATYGKSNTLPNYCGSGLDSVHLAVDPGRHKYYHLELGTYFPTSLVKMIDKAKSDYQMPGEADWDEQLVDPWLAATIVETRGYAL